MPTITFQGKQINIDDTNNRDARGFQIFEGPQGELFTLQGGTFILSRPARISDGLPSTGNPEADQIIRAFEEGVISGGKTLNPEITFSPEEISGFLDQAVKELSPFFQSQFKAIRQDLEQGLVELGESFELQAQGQAQTFRGGLRDIREQAGETGAGISGERARSEREFAESTQRGIQQTTSRAIAVAGQAARQVERRIGTQNLESVNIPGIRALDISGFQPGLTFAKQAGTRRAEIKPLFTLSPDVIKGTLPKEQVTEQKVRAREIEKQERTRRLNVI